MDLKSGIAMHETMVRIPASDAVWIKEQGMTYSGTFKRGLQLLKENPQRNEELRDAKMRAEKFERLYNRVLDELNTLRTAE